MKKVLVIVNLCVLLFSCEKDINFKLNAAPTVLVVDAQIENRKAPIVILNNSFSFFDSINPQLLSGSFVHDATVTISNGTLTHQLKEYSYGVTPGIRVYFYSIDSSNLSTAFMGQLNTGYTLHIAAGGKNYTANTTIPSLAKKIDSLWWKPAPFAKDSNDVVLFLKATDPPGLGNYVRYFTKKNQGQFLPGDNSVFDDQVIDGTTYQFQIEPGIDRNNKVSFDSNYFKRGDTISMKLCNIDKVAYTFWSTWEFAYQSIGNPFAQPNKVIGNLSNGALGAFYGYAADYKTLVVPK
jgi:signal peptidase I